MYLYVRKYVCIYLYIYTHLYTYIYLCIHIYIHIYVSIYMYIRKYTYAFIYISIYGYLCMYIFTYVNIYIHRCLTAIYTHAHRHPDRESAFVHAAARLFQIRLHVGSTPGDGVGGVLGGISDTHLSSIAGAKCIWSEIFKSKWQVQGQCSRDLETAGESDMHFVEGMSVCLRLCVGRDPHSQSERTTQRSCWRPGWIEEPLRIEIVWFARRFRRERGPSTTTPIWQIGAPWRFKCPSRDYDRTRALIWRLRR